MALAQSIAAAASEAHAFLHRLADASRAPVAAHDVGIVVAHPDDETIGCGAQLPRLQGVTIVLVTDGAPLKLEEARRHRCPSVQAYAALRAQEFARAMKLAHIARDHVIALDFSDQNTGPHLAELARTLYFLLSARRWRILLTHAYEGGHPDHDATAFAVHAAAALRARTGEPVAILEMPLYRADRGAAVYQRFAPGPDDNETAVRLTNRERAFKRKLFACYASQQEVLSSFTLEAEYVRPAPCYDFSALPNSGELLYDRFDWGMTGERWLALVRSARTELALGEASC